MHGERQQVWLNQLKIAIVEQDIPQLESLMDDLPALQKKEDIDSALCLLQEAITLVSNLRDNTRASMMQMKKNIDFLNATQANKTSKFDIIS